MKSRLNLKPGQKGTKKLVGEYGKSLLYGRYRYDETRGVRLKTVEIVEREDRCQGYTSDRIFVESPKCKMCSPDTYFLPLPAS
ncbi:MAG TPA: hypothetical protein VLZ03_11845 [Thermodesulfobacteriota bacterium]|nr:hypothetical protein [Thermodesulfobacteriota bacterium]